MEDGVGSAFLSCAHNFRSTPKKPFSSALDIKGVCSGILNTKAKAALFLLILTTRGGEKDSSLQYLNRENLGSTLASQSFTKIVAIAYQRSRVGNTMTSPTQPYQVVRYYPE